MPACPSCHVVLNRKQTPNAFSRRGSRLGRCFLLGLALISFFCLDCRRAAPPAPAIKYNLLVISIDTCRADHLTCYGYNRSTSPHLDQLAKEGVLFEDATAAASWTVPSHMSMFTSLYPSVHGVQNFNNQLGEGVPTLAQCLAKSGYATAAFITAPVLNHYFGFNRGFQLYDDFTVPQRFGIEHPMAGIENSGTGSAALLDQVVTTPSSRPWARSGSRSIPGRTSSSSCTIGTAITIISRPRPTTRNSTPATRAQRTAATSSYASRKS